MFPGLVFVHWWCGGFVQMDVPLMMIPPAVVAGIRSATLDFRS